MDPYLRILGVASAFLVTRLVGEGMVTLPNPDATADELLVYYRAHGPTVVTAQVFMFVSAAALFIFSGILERSDGRLGRAGKALAVVSGLSHLPVFLLPVFAIVASTGTALVLDNARTFLESAFFFAVAIFGGIVISAGTVRSLIVKAIAALTIPICVARGIASLITTPAFLDTAAPALFVALVVALAVVQQPVSKAA